LTGASCHVEEVDHKCNVSENTLGYIH